MIIVDANCLAHLGRYTIGAFDNGVIFYFLRMIKKLAKSFGTQFVFAWDSRKSKRKTIYPDYKSSRKIKFKTELEKIEDDLMFEQIIELRRKVLPKFGFKNNFIKTGYEADDIIASIVKDYEIKDDKIVATVDDDLFQLLDWCKIYNLRNKKIISKDSFKKQYGIDPSDWIYVKAIAGCSSDNIVGICGVGIKTAVRYLLNELKSEKIVKKIEENKEAIERNLPLVSLPMEGVGKFEIDFDEDFLLDNFLDICTKYKFDSFLKEEEIKSWKSIFNMR